LNHLLVIISAALGGVVLLLLVLLAWTGRRSRRRADERVGAVVQTLEKRMDELAVELAGAVERAEEEGRRGRFLGEIAGSIDMDEVLARTLEAGTRMDGVDAALIRLESPEGPPTIAAHGLSADGAEAIAGPPDGARARAIEVSYRYRDDEEDPASLIAGGLAVPLEENGSRLGYLAVYTRHRDRQFAEDDIRQLEDLTHRATPAIENARRFREARQRADGASQSPLLPRDARPGVRARASLQPPPRADRLRSRRLQGSERQGRAPRRRRRARRSGGARPRGDPHG
jgi:GAF domain-containing protein